MKRKQTLPTVELGGVGVLKEIKTRDLPTAKYEIPENTALETLSKGVSSIQGALNLKKKMDEDGMKTETATVLKQYRTQMRNATTEEEFNSIAEASEQDVSTRFLDRFNGKGYWNDNGERILTAHRKDVENLRQLKMADFGKNSLRGMLAENQELLAYSAAASGEGILTRGVEEIEKTPFLSVDEKVKYRDGYLQTGILNLALNDVEGAARMADKFFPASNEGLKMKISEAGALRQQAEKAFLENQRREMSLQQSNKVFSLWREREEGRITPAEFYVMTAEDDADVLWGDKEIRSRTPLADAYRIVKRVNSGEKLSAEDVREAGNLFISAYRQKKIGLDEVGAWHNQLMLSQGDKAVSGMLFDKDIDSLADRVLLPDLSVAARGANTTDFMEQKAKLAFEIYENYYSKKTALADEFIAGGGQITPALEKRFRRQALEETREEMGLKENIGGELNFADLKRLLRNVYTGYNEQEIWRKFYEKAPYAEDKKALFKQIAIEEQKRELSYPQFDTLAELEAAGLETGERFYFKGRLAVKV